MQQERLIAKAALPWMAAGILVASAGAQAFDVHGYIRSGGGWTTKGGSQSCFDLAGTPGKWRLGNECDTYMELGVDQDIFKSKEEGGPKFTYHNMIKYATGFQSMSGGDNIGIDRSDRSVAILQNWVEAHNLPFMNGGSVWVGKRYYDRYDIHMRDWQFWGATGYGVGAQNVKAGPVKLSYAIFRNSKTDASGDTPPTAANPSGGNSSDVNKKQSDATTRHDFRVGGIELGNAGELKFGLQYNKADTRGFDANRNEKNGWMFTGMHQIKALGGTNTAALQYGRGSANNLDPGDPNNLPGNGAKTWRVLDHLVWNVNDVFTGAVGVAYQRHTQEGGSRDAKWLMVGVRPVWHVSDYFKLQAEIGHDEIKGDSQLVGADNRTRKLTKVTFAPTIVAGRGFWARPELRVFVTHAKWNDAARDIGGGVAGGTTGTFGMDTKGTTYGFQAEAWF